MRCCINNPNVLNNSFEIYLCEWQQNTLLAYRLEGGWQFRKKPVHRLTQLIGKIYLGLLRDEQLLVLRRFFNGTSGS